MSQAISPSRGTKSSPHRRALPVGVPKSFYSQLVFEDGRVKLGNLALGMELRIKTVPLTLLAWGDVVVAFQAANIPALESSPELVNPWSS